MFETIRRTFASSNTNQRMKSKYVLSIILSKNKIKQTNCCFFLIIKRSAQTIITPSTTIDSNEETDSSLSDDFKSIQNSIISITRPSSIVLKR